MRTVEDNRRSVLTEVFSRLLSELCLPVPVGPAKRKEFGLVLGLRLSWRQRMLVETALTASSWSMICLRMLS